MISRYLDPEGYKGWSRVLGVLDQVQFTDGGCGEHTSISNSCELENVLGIRV